MASTPIQMPYKKPHTLRKCMGLVLLSNTSKTWIPIEPKKQIRCWLTWILEEIYSHPPPIFITIVQCFIKTKTHLSSPRLCGRTLYYVEPNRFNHFMRPPSLAKWAADHHNPPLPIDPPRSPFTLLLCPQSFGTYLPRYAGDALPHNSFRLLL